MIYLSAAYHEHRRRSFGDWLVLLVVVAIEVGWVYGSVQWGLW